VNNFNFFSRKSQNKESELVIFYLHENLVHGILNFWHSILLFSGKSRGLFYYDLFANYVDNVSLFCLSAIKWFAICEIFCSHGHDNKEYCLLLLCWTEVPVSEDTLKSSR
jgi:hypothetical protein